MSRQVSVKNLRVKRNQGTLIGSSGEKKIRCEKCKDKAVGATGKARRIKNIKLLMENQGIISISDKTDTKEDSILILAAMGIGVVDRVPVQPNPRSQVDIHVPIAADFSLLKIETDTTQIPNSQIQDVKSRVLKRGPARYVKASDIRPFSETDSFFKPDSVTTLQEAKDVERFTDSKINRNLSGFVNKLIVQQRKIPNKLMEPQFKKAMGMAG